MDINLKELKAMGTISKQDLTIDMGELLTSRSDIVSVGPVKVSFVAEALEKTINVSGHGELMVEFICSRCLRHYKQHYDIPFEETFSQDEAVAESDEEGDIYYIADDVIAFQPHVEENIVLGLPFIPICKEDCLGLCAMCGQDKNEHSCDCQISTIDPRLEGLKAFFD